MMVEELAILIFSVACAIALSTTEWACVVKYSLMAFADAEEIDACLLGKLGQFDDLPDSLLCWDSFHS